MKPLVSVIIPVYNVESYIGETLKSVFNQTFKDFEIVVVNDGSKDNTLHVASEILSDSGFPFKIIDQINRGVSVARNVGMENSVGRYIKFLDGDDRLLPNAIEVLVNAIQKCGCGLVYGGQDVAALSGKVTQRYEDMYKQEWIYANYEKAIKEFLFSKVYISVNSCLIDRDLIDKFGLRFVPGAKYSEDNEFISKVIYYSNNVSYVGQSTCLLTVRPDSTTKMATLSVFHNAGSMKRLKRFFEAKGEYEIVEILERYSIPSAYAWSLGNLAYNGYPYRKWIKIAWNKTIRQYIKKFDIPFENKTNFHKQLLMTKSMYMFSPTLAYTVMRTVSMIYTRKTKR